MHRIEGGFFYGFVYGVAGDFVYSFVHGLEDDFVYVFDFVFEDVPFTTLVFAFCTVLYPFFARGRVIDHVC